MTKATDATSAYAMYEAAFNGDLLTQNHFHTTDGEGRHLACALGTLGEGVKSAGDCPATVMPRWLAQMVPWFFDGQAFDDAKRWGLEFYAELKRINGQVPFSVIHDWQANFVGKLAIEMAEKYGRDAEPHKALAEMQWKALTGQKFTADEWRPILRSAFHDIYLFQYRADADADAYANAYANANANAYAYANANANADAYADAYAYAYANAYANADANANNITKLASGLVECLKRVPA